MEVKSENTLLLSNYEVYSLLKELQSSEKGGKKMRKLQKHLATISYETIKYLEKTPCSQQDAQLVRAFLTAVQPFRLTKAEKLQLLNQRPTTAVEIQLLIEESEERLSEQEIEQLLTIVATTLPGSEPSEQDMEQS
ncbi:PREDICTED: DNA-directed RNA polymerase III subunit RPC9-like isoform X2 [Priapulus caudatus]|uniref:DNA-directed RNA polymerase III subunit RPC9 n=1 Tax=Priapulus caudatus TaxID=37621 RepID=A0ABM1FA42_PRICU|nr:PREDICTED: DNA-directed RNA polymerase III subunit RPC9-like isoform X2 [Priapulus caudatus]